MATLSSSLHDIFSKNRTEEIGYDVWEHFVVPPYYNYLDLKTAKKPRIIIGGRGCGKTMLLRYLSHQSMFSPKRPYISEDDVQHIGLYWRVDTQFCNAMIKRELDDEKWESAFNHLIALVLGMETLKSLDSLAESKFSKFDLSVVNSIDFSRLQAFDKSLPASAGKLYSNLEDRLWKFETWVNDIKKSREPLFFPGPTFIKAIISIIKSQVKSLKEAIYFIYLDEYENLAKYQKRIINTWLKHSEAPLIFNLAVKRNAFDFRDTIGGEALSDIHDFRRHDLEEYIFDKDFPIFAAEILFLKLSFAGLKNLPIVEEDLRNPDKLSDRRNRDYIDKLLSTVEEYLPDLSHKELARSVFQNPTLKDKLFEKVSKALVNRSCNIPAHSFINAEFPEASIVTPALLYRKNLKPNEILKEFNQLTNTENNKFTGPTNWIHNNFVGCLLQLYAPYFRACPFYAGFNTFCSLSRGNIRHFLELCHNSLYKAAKNGGLAIPVDADTQAEAARLASKAFLGEIRSFGRLGEQLHTFILRLGSLFELAHRRPSQSESEISHFSIRKGNEELLERDTDFLREATKFSVLLESFDDTKRKGELDPQSAEYILNPIYAPYFHITYRKKRKLNLSTREVICLIRGTLDDFSTLMRQLSRKWSVETEEMTPTLFSIIE